jgi:hypothetical protein
VGLTDSRHAARWHRLAVAGQHRPVGVLLEAIAGPALGPAWDSGADPPPDLRGRTVGLLTQFVEAGCDPEITATTHAAAALLVRSVDLPRQEHIDAIHAVIQFAEAAAVHRHWIEDQRPRYEPAVLDGSRPAALAATDYPEAQRARELLRMETARAINGVRSSSPRRRRSSPHRWIQTHGIHPPMITVVQPGPGMIGMPCML